MLYLVSSVPYVVWEPCVSIKLCPVSSLLMCILCLVSLVPLGEKFEPFLSLVLWEGVGELLKTTKDLPNNINSSTLLWSKRLTAM